MNGNRAASVGGTRGGRTRSRASVAARVLVSSAFFWAVGCGGGGWKSSGSAGCTPYNQGGYATSYGTGPAAPPSLPATPPSAPSAPPPTAPSPWPGPGLLFGGSAVSADGRYVAFQSARNDLVPGDTGGSYDVFVRDTLLSTTVLVSVALNGGPADNVSCKPAISDDGRFVAFDSMASNLVANDLNGTSDVFVRDLRLGTTRRVSVSATGGEGNGPSAEPTISGDGRLVAFTSSATDLVSGDVNGLDDVFVVDLMTDAVVLASVAADGAPADGPSYHPALSGDGSRLAFDSFAANLVAGDANGKGDVFVLDLPLGTIRRVSVAANGAEGDDRCWGPALSADGRYVVFDSWATNLVPGTGSGGDTVLRVDLTTGDVGKASGWSSTFPTVSADGNRVAYMAPAPGLRAGDPATVWGVFVYDFTTQASVRVGAGALAAPDADDEGVPSLSADGLFVAFKSWTSHPAQGTTDDRDNVLYDLAKGAAVLVSAGL